MADWDICRLEDIVSRVSMGPFGSSIKVSTFVETGVPIINGQQLKSGRVVDSDFNFITEEHADQLKKANALPGDIVLTHRGTLGQVAMIPRVSTFPRYIVSQSQFLIECDESKMIPEYLTYFLRSPVGQHLLLANATQTGVPSIAQPVTYIRTIPVPVPSLPEQRAIAEVLEALDDKIETNHRTALTVDRLLRAEVEHATISDPDSRTCSLGDLVERISIGVDPTQLGRAVPYIGLEHMPRGSMILDEWGNSEGLGSGKARFARNDILFGRLRPYFKKVGVAPVSGICSTDVLVLRPKANSPLPVALAIAASDSLIDYATAASTGTRMPRVSWEYLAAFQTEVPGPEAMRILGDRLNPLLGLTVDLTAESRTLAALRDILLSELFAGRVCAPAATELIEVS